MLVNGESRDTITLADRGLAYGDGVFETVLVYRRRPVLLERHLRRLQRGCEHLGIPDCSRAVREDVAALGDELGEANVLKIMVTRGSGGRGYRVEECGPPTRIVSLHPAPSHAALAPEQGISAFVCRQRLAQSEALAGIKHLNRLEQVLASREWPADEKVLEGIMLDTAGRVIEGTRTNIFWASRGTLYTPDLRRCGVAGIMREVLLEAFAGEPVRIVDRELEQVLEADEMFVCNSVIGIWPVVSLQTASATRDFSAGGFARRARAVFEQSLAGAHEQ